MTSTGDFVTFSWLNINACCAFVCLFFIIPVEYKLCLHVIAVEQTDMSTQFTNSYYNHLIKKKNLPKS